MRIFSGIQPTGKKHLGNYIGAIRQYVDGQERAAASGDESLFCVVDLHAVTVAYDPAELRERLYDTTAVLLAAGLDPSKCVLFRQSDVPAHTELSWLLSSVVPNGRLSRMHQFRDKSGAQRELVSSGLLFYPVLMAADVLAYRADEVPVGEDQREHLELMRDAARDINRRFAPELGPGEGGKPGLLMVPEQRTPEVGARVMDLQDPTRKMSTTGGSVEGTVYVLDEGKALEKKFKRAVTDSETEIRYDRAEKPGVSNLLEILAASKRISIDEAVASMADARGYGDLKMAALTAVDEELAPLRERYAELRPDVAALEAALAQGAARATELAAGTLADVREAMGVGVPRAFSGARPGA
ncbi:MAG: tryptophan--tRNA ligase [Solirubrobacteraceae bacterium]|nr:tryptophan--tRNA ligase [Solirubrobacteraceae bacterium]